MEEVNIIFNNYNLSKENLNWIYFIPIFIFFSGYVFDWIKKKCEKQKESISYFNLILEWIIQIEKPLKIQIKWCNNIAIIIKSSLENSQLERLEFNSFLIDKIDSISIERYINTFVINRIGEGDKYEKTYNLLNQLEFLKKTRIEILNNYDKYGLLKIELLNEWNSNFIKLNNIIYLHSQQNVDSSTLNEEFHLEVFKIIDVWKKELINYQSSIENYQSSIENSNTNLIVPLLNLVDNELHKNHNNEFASNLYLNLQSLSFTFMKLKNLILTYEDLFKTNSKDMQESLNSLINAKDYFKNNTKLKNVFFIK